MGDRAAIYDAVLQVVNGKLDEAHLSVKLVTKPQENAGR